MSAELFSGNEFTVRQNIFTFFGASIRVFDKDMQQIMFCRQKAFKLKEDIRIYRDETKTEEVFRIAARNIIDFAATYDIIDSSTETKVGSLRRRGFKSILKDEWQIMDANDQEVGKIKEDNAFLALLRRFLSSLIPQNFKVYHGDVQVAEFRRGFNPFVNKMKVDFSHDTENVLDHRIGLASAILVILMEARSN
ncbi:MAG: hypothetical protein OHK0017_03710 [Patescibacteria group bacterium]